MTRSGHVNIAVGIRAIPQRHASAPENSCAKVDEEQARGRRGGGEDQSLRLPAAHGVA
jgi:hypothetical protein